MTEINSSSARVVLTGAAGGIGAATADALRARGAAVVGLDLVASGDLIACDVRDQASVDAAIAEAEQRLGGIDVLINCAGIGDPQSAGERPGEDALRVLDINLLGPWRVSAAALSALRASRGRVANVASGLAHLPMPFATAYCISKRGLVMYSDLLRLEHGDAIKVTSVYPGYIRTPIHDAPGAKGVSLEGTVPVEQVEDAAAALVRAALDDDPPRDLATTRQGTLSYGFLRLAPRRLVDRLVRSGVRRAVHRGRFDRSEMAADLVARTRGI
ncbi:MAG: SDR family NAD(P)-dependent oxidoreductase [Solirubrobacteraceae bacterium]